MSLNFVMTRLAPSLIFWLFLVPPPQASAQTTNATCLAGFNWSFNSRSQSPCLMAAYLVAPCLNDPSGSFVIALKPDFHYLPPTTSSANECNCNTVVYSMFAACTACQADGLMLPWSGWQDNCSQSFIREYPRPVPEGTSIPSWAYLDVVALDSFNTSAAQIENKINRTEITSSPTATSSFSSIGAHSATAATMTTPSSLTANLSATATPSQSQTTTGISDTVPAAKKSRTAGIVGGIIGGLAAVTLAVATIFWRKKRRAQKVYAQTPIILPSAFESSVLAEKKFYDPDDPSTFPDARIQPLRYGGWAEI